jgi:hypothetical protein
MAACEQDTGMRHHSIIPLVIVVWLVIASSRADDPHADAPPPSPLQKLIDDSLDWYELSAGERGETPLTPTPVLRWDNNSRGSSTGLTVLYIAHGRPEAACAVYPWDGRLVHEFDSLSRGPIRGSEDGAVFWSAETPGVAFRPVPDVDDPHPRPATRLRQMKTLSERFDVTLVGWRGDNSDRQELRLLPKPLYRYENPTGDVLDGAVFAFVMGVDPEALLLIEAFGSDGDAQWEYAFVRRTSGELAGRLDGGTVWSVERYPETKAPQRPHRSMTRPLDPAAAGSTDVAPLQKQDPVPSGSFNSISTTDREQR